jgi:hypothetical protein
MAPVSHRTCSDIVELVGWSCEPGLRDFAPVVEQLAGT